MHPRISLPRSWTRHTKSAIVQILALSHFAFTAMVARAAKNRSHVRLQAATDRLKHELVLLQEELRIKDARMERVPTAARTSLYAAGEDGDHGAPGRSRLVR